MVKFIHTADIHLDSPLRGLERYDGAPVDHLRQATRRAFDNLVELAVQGPVDFVLIAGDLYDGNWKDYNTGLYFVSRMTRLKEAGVRVLFVSGNHDAASLITKTLRLPDNVTVFPADKPATVRFEDLRVAVHGQSYKTPAVKQDLAAHYPEALPGYVNIGMLHTCATGRDGHEPYAPCTIATLMDKGYDYWALGHVHKRETLSHIPLIAFPGNIQGRHIRETGAKGCLLATVQEDGTVQAEFRALDVIRWERLEVDAGAFKDGYHMVDDVSLVLKTLVGESEGLPLAVRIDVSGPSQAHDAVAADTERWAGELRSMAMDVFGDRVWVEKVKFNTVPLAALRPDEPPDGPVGTLLAYIESLRSDPEQLLSLGASLNELTQKLPSEINQGADRVDPENAAWLNGILDQVRAILLDRLFSPGDGQ